MLNNAEEAGNVHVGTARTKSYRIGAVSFFNARPLIYGLEQRKNIVLQRLVPARIAQAIDNDLIDVGLVPSIDYQQTANEWQILPVGGISSAGEVLTVRLFSHQPLEQISRVACDPDSHTSIVLLQIIRHFRVLADVRVAGEAGQGPIEIVPLEGDVISANGRASEESAILLIGDKVMPQLSNKYWSYQLDLGQAWTEYTGLPFVYAFWALRVQDRPTGEIEDIVSILQQAYRQGLAEIDRVAEIYAPTHGFEVEQGKKYLRENISYYFSRRQQRGLTRFYDLAYKLHLVPFQRPLRIYTGLQSALPTAGG